MTGSLQSQSCQIGWPRYGRRILCGLSTRGVGTGLGRTWQRTKFKANQRELLQREREKDAVTLNESQLQSEDELINVLVKLVKQYAKVVDSFGS